jgi:hypothetical protein
MAAASKPKNFGTSFRTILQARTCSRRRSCGHRRDRFRQLLASVRPARRETPQSIVARNCREIAANGWTLWSFQYRTRKTFDDWSRELARVSAKVPVFCSNGNGQGTNGISEVT